MTLLTTKKGSWLAAIAGENNQNSLVSVFFANQTDDLEQNPQDAAHLANLYAISDSLADGQLMAIGTTDAFPDATLSASGSLGTPDIQVPSTGQETLHIVSVTKNTFCTKPVPIEDAGHKTPTPVEESAAVATTANPLPLVPEAIGVVATVDSILIDLPASPFIQEEPAVQFDKIEAFPTVSYTSTLAGEISDTPDFDTLQSINDDPDVQWGIIVNMDPTDETSIDSGLAGEYTADLDNNSGPTGIGAPSFVVAAAALIFPSMRLMQLNLDENVLKTDIELVVDSPFDIATDVVAPGFAIDADLMVALYDGAFFTGSETTSKDIGVTGDISTIEPEIIIEGINSDLPVTTDAAADHMQVDGSITAGIEIEDNVTVSNLLNLVSANWICYLPALESVPMPELEQPILVGEANYSSESVQFIGLSPELAQIS